MTKTTPYNKSLKLRQNCIQKIQTLENDLMKYGYRTKISQLIQNYEFQFDIHKIITNQNENIVSKLCFCYFRFLMLRMMFHFYQENKNEEKMYKMNTEMALPFRKTVSNVYKKVQTIQKQRATTTAIPQLHQKSKIQKARQKIINAKKKYTNKEETKPQIEIQQGQENKIIERIMLASVELKQAYFQLTQSYHTRHGIGRIQKICFLITLIAPDVLHPIIESFEEEFKIVESLNMFRQTQMTSINMNEEQNSSSSEIEEEIYIVFIYQTLGNLVTPNAFTFLKKKYIKNIIFHGSCDNSYMKLIRSLKHIKQKLISQKEIVLIKGRKQREKIKDPNSKQVTIQNDDSTDFNKEKMRKFIRQALKTKQPVNFSKKLHRTIKQDELEQFNNKFRSTFYPSYSKPKPKVALSKENTANKLSTSLKVNMNIQGLIQYKKGQEVKKKYVNNADQTFYRLKFKIDQKKERRSKIKSQRSSNKFNQAKQEQQDQDVQIQNGREKETIEQMKRKAEKIRFEALKDRQTIQLFHPHKRSRTNNKENSQHANQKIKNRESLNLLKTNRFRTLGRKSKIFTQKSPLHEDDDTPTQKQQLKWKEIYNIKTENQIPHHHKAAQKFVLPYKYLKNSDKLRKVRKVFEEDCKKREEVIFGDKSIPVQKIKML